MSNKPSLKGNKKLLSNILTNVQCRHFVFWNNPERCPNLQHNDITNSANLNPICVPKNILYFIFCPFSFKLSLASAERQKFAVNENGKFFSHIMKAETLESVSWNYIILWKPCNSEVYQIVFHTG